MNEVQKWTLLKSEQVYDHKWYTLRRDEVSLPNGIILDDYFVSIRPEVAIVFPVTPEGQVIMVRQYKHAVGEIVLEFPGGIFNSDKESGQEAALRELVEETGYVAEKVTKLSVIYGNPTRDTNNIHLFLAQDVKKVAEQHLDSTESIVIEQYPLEKIPRMVSSGEINVASAIAAAFLALEELKEQQR